MTIIQDIVESYVDKNYKTIDELPSDSITKISDKKMIEDTKILIIDDENIEVEDTLRRIGYKVILKNDIDTLSDVEPYNIIICDYKGVGQKFNSEFEGLNLVRLIKEKYPEKIVYLLSAADFNPKANDYIKYADELVYKSEENKLIEYIRQDCSKLFDPRDRWNHYKSILRDKNIRDKDIVKLEHLYVKSFIEKKDLLSNNALFKKIESNLNINFDIKIGLINL